MLARMAAQQIGYNTNTIHSQVLNPKHSEGALGSEHRASLCSPLSHPHAAQEMVHPNILHLLSQTHTLRSCPLSSPLPSSLSPARASAIRGILFFTPYSLTQHWNGFILGASSLTVLAELPCTCLRAVAACPFRSSRSPHKRNSFSRRVSSAAGDLRRLCGAEIRDWIRIRTQMGKEGRKTHSSASSLSKYSASWPAT